LLKIHDAPSKNELLAFWHERKRNNCKSSETGFLKEIHIRNSKATRKLNSDGML